MSVSYLRGCGSSLEGSNTGDSDTGLGCTVRCADGRESHLLRRSGSRPSSGSTLAGVETYRRGDAGKAEGASQQRVCDSTACYRVNLPEEGGPGRAVLCHGEHDVVGCGIGGIVVEGSVTASDDTSQGGRAGWRELAYHRPRLHHGTRVPKVHVYIPRGVCRARVDGPSQKLEHVP